ncbi:hypothetical protein [Paenibacillus sp. GCM10012303]|uniref:hypothetical protein n=1 Tax=Paenibacillus sp. GCM10012303 TaxID=3317340 RepID=UPI00361C24B2
MLRHKAFKPGLLLTVVLLVCFCSGRWQPASAAAAAERQPDNVLLLYDSLAKGTSREGNVAVLQQQLAAYRVQVTTMSLDRYRQGTMQSYGKVITVINAADLNIANEAYKTDLAAYPGEYMHIGGNLPGRIADIGQGVLTRTDGRSVRLEAGKISQSTIHPGPLTLIAGPESGIYGTITVEGSAERFPYGVREGRNTYLPFMEKGNLSELAAAHVLKRWLQVETAGRTYAVIKDITPFSDFKLLEAVTDRLYEAGIPFAGSIRPVISNTDYPAMKRYVEALKYVQSRNGAILIQAPVVLDGVSRSGQLLRKRMEDFIAVLAGYQVAPLGIGAELYWSYDKAYAEGGMGFFSSAVLFPDEKPLPIEPADTSKAFSSALYSMTVRDLRRMERYGGAIPAFPMDTAVTIAFTDDERQLASAVQTLIDSRIPFADYRDGRHEVRTDAHRIASEDGVITIDGNRLQADYAPSIVSEDYKYQEETRKSFTRMFQVQNRFFIVVIGAALIVFGVFLVAGRRLYKRKFMK